MENKLDWSERYRYCSFSRIYHALSMSLYCFMSPFFPSMLTSDRFMREITSALVFLHTLHPPIVHRDLKSPNVLVLLFCVFLSFSTSVTVTVTIMHVLLLCLCPRLLLSVSPHVSVSLRVFVCVLAPVPPLCLRMYVLCRCARICVLHVHQTSLTLSPQLTKVGDRLVCKVADVGCGGALGLVESFRTSISVLLFLSLCLIVVYTSVCLFAAEVSIDVRVYCALCAVLFCTILCTVK
jgi:hypothetical protein